MFNVRYQIAEDISDSHSQNAKAMNGLFTRPNAEMAVVQQPITDSCLNAMDLEPPECPPTVSVHDSMKLKAK